MTTVTTPICEGDELLDNDPRMPGRRLCIVTVGDTSVVAEDRKNSRRVMVRLARIYTDGKPRRRGFTLVKVAS